MFGFRIVRSGAIRDLEFVAKSNTRLINMMSDRIDDMEKVIECHREYINGELDKFANYIADMNSVKDGK